MTNNFKELLNIPEYWKSERFLSLQNFDNEEWKDINEYEGLYQISNYGRVKSYKFDKEKILKPSINNYGYLYIFVCKDRNIKIYLIHRLVALAFIPNPLNKRIVNMIDTNKLNNMVNNLEWNTQGGNIKHAWKRNINGIKFGSKKVYCPELNKEFYSTGEAARQLNLNQSNISQCCGSKLKSAGKVIINGIETKLTWKYI